MLSLLFLVSWMIVLIEYAIASYVLQLICCNHILDVNIFTVKPNKRGLSDDVKVLLDGMQLKADGTSVDPEALNNWDKSVNKILKQNPRVRPMFELVK